MNPNLLEQLQQITPEEQKLLARNSGVEKELYTSSREFVIDSGKMLKQGKLIAVRPHTRFADFPAHRHNYVEVMYVCRGSITHVIDGVTVTMNEGDLLFLNQQIRHEVKAASLYDIGINLIILPEFFEQPAFLTGADTPLTGFLVELLRRKKGRGQFLLFSAKGILQIENLMENHIDSLLNDPEPQDDINRALMVLLFLYLGKYAKTLRRDSPNRFEDVVVLAARRYIEEHYKTATLGELAQSLREQPSLVSRLLKQGTGKTFKELLQEHRLQAACSLLQKTSLSVNEIAAAVGYENNSFFHRLFRDVMGITPGEYRKERREQDEE